MGVEEVLQFASVAIVVLVIAYSIIVAEARLSSIEDGLNDLVTIMHAKNSLARSNEELAETVKDLSLKNEQLYQMLLVKRDGVQSNAPGLIAEKLPNVEKE